MTPRRCIELRMEYRGKPMCKACGMGDCTFAVVFGSDEKCGSNVHPRCDIEVPKDAQNAFSTKSPMKCTFCANQHHMW